MRQTPAALFGFQSSSSSNSSCLASDSRRIGVMYCKAPEKKNKILYSKSTFYMSEVTFSIESGDALWRSSGLGGLLSLDLEVDLFVADGRPKLDALEDKKES